MKTETHLKFAEILCRSRLKSAGRFQKLCFKLGCILPDIDMVSYLRGFTEKPFFGHNWSNCRRYIMSVADRSSFKRIGYFSLGVFTHYLCDAFTFTHNSAYLGGLLEHTRYEKRLHAFVLENGSRMDDIKGDRIISLRDFIESEHKMYEGQPGNEQKDARYIVSTVQAAVKYCLEKTYGADIRCAER